MSVLGILCKQQLTNRPNRPPKSFDFPRLLISDQLGFLANTASDWKESICHLWFILTTIRDNYDVIATEHIFLNSGVGQCSKENENRLCGIEFHVRLNHYVVKYKSRKYTLQEEPRQKRRWSYFDCRGRHK